MQYLFHTLSSSALYQLIRFIAPTATEFLHPHWASNTTSHVAWLKWEILLCKLFPILIIFPDLNLLSLISIIRRPMECYLCGKVVSAWRAHMKIHRKEEKKQLVRMLEETKVINCHYCDSKYSTITGYMYHKERCRFAPHPPVPPLVK